MPITIDRHHSLHTHKHTSQGENSLPPELAKVPHTLWATHKYYVGVIKSAQPVGIRAKSNYRPNQPQYPLKPEAIQGIKPVFDSLLVIGITVPCPDSRAHSCVSGEENL